MTRPPAPALSPAEAARVGVFDAAPVPPEVAAINAAVEVGQIAVRQMAFDWYCPSDSRRPRHTCPECIAEIAAAAAIAAYTSPAEEAVKRVEALTDEAETRQLRSLSRMFGGEPFPAVVTTDRLRAALASPAPAPQTYTFQTAEVAVPQDGAR